MVEGKEQVVLATGNAGKVREFSGLLAGLGLEVITQSELDVTDAEETGLSFVENAILKARNAARQTNLSALADDSGIVVDALDGRPGIYSSRYSETGESADNNVKLLTELQGVPEAQRTARFHCCIVFVRNESDPVPMIAQASWEGVILNAPSGERGFGYDPLFFVPTHDCTAAELDMDEKNRISHRGQAMQVLREMLTEYMIPSSGASL